MQQFIYQFSPADRVELATDPQAWSAADESVASEHFEYLKQGVADGVVLLAGRSPDGLGPAIVIFEAEDASAADTFMRSDPFVTSGMFRASLHPYRIALWRSPEI